jgi:hypothetical protein
MRENFFELRSCRSLKNCDQPLEEFLWDLIFTYALVVFVRIDDPAHVLNIKIGDFEAFDTLLQVLHSGFHIRLERFHYDDEQQRTTKLVLIVCLVCLQTLLPAFYGSEGTHTSTVGSACVSALGHILYHALLFATSSDNVA